MTARIAPPTVAFNAVIPRQNIPEPVIGVGKFTGQQHFVLGDNPNGQETMTITPPGGMPRRAMVGAPAGAVSYANGGYVTAGYGGPSVDQITAAGGYNNEDERYYYLASKANSGVTLGQDAYDFLNSYSPTYAQQQPQQPQQPVASGPAAPSTAYTGYVPSDPLEGQRAAAQAAVDARAPVAAATQAQIQANAGVVAAQGNQNLANQSVVNAVNGTFAPRTAQIAAQGNVINQQQQLTSAQRAQIQQQQQVDAQRLAEEQRVQAAAANVADQTAVAQALNTRANEDYKYQLAGLATPAEVNTANGADNSSLPVGTRAQLQTQEQLLTTKQGQNEKLRAIQLDQAQNIVKLAATDVDAAQQAAARVGLTVAQAQLLVDQAQNAAAGAGVAVQQAQNAANQAGIGVNQANLGVYNAATAVQQAAILPQGMAGYVVYTNPFTGASNYMTPAAAKELQYQDTQQINAINQGQYAGLSPSSVTSLFYNGLITGKPTIDEAHATQAIIANGGTPQVAAALIADAKTRAQAALNSDPKNVAAMSIFGKPYNQLTIDEKADPRLIDAILAAQGIA